MTHRKVYNGWFAAARLLNTDCSCAEVRLSVEFEKAMGEISKFNRTGLAS